MNQEILLRLDIMIQTFGKDLMLRIFFRVLKMHQMDWGEKTF